MAPKQTVWPTYRCLTDGDIANVILDSTFGGKPRGPILLIEINIDSGV